MPDRPQHPAHRYSQHRCFFPDKEALATALYDRYYTDAQARAQALVGTHGHDACPALLALYFDAKHMTRSEIFNKFRLNEALFAYTASKNDALWQTIVPAFAGVPEEDRAAVRIIIDGAFEKLLLLQLSPDAVIERLVKGL